MKKKNKNKNKKKKCLAKCVKLRENMVPRHQLDRSENGRNLMLSERLP